MKRCEHCGLDYGSDANYCVNCGRLLTPRSAVAPQEDPRGGKAGFDIFLLTLAGSLLLSWLLIVVFKLPIFILGAFLPLFWFRGKKR